MNAQEAIENLENILEELLELRQEIMDDPVEFYTFEEGEDNFTNKKKIEDKLERLNNKIDSYSIVIESAKLLHNSVVADDRIRDKKRHFYPNKNPRLFYGKPLELLGIKEGADE